MQYILLAQSHNFVTIKEKSFTCYIHTVCLKVFMIFFQNNTIYHLCPHMCCTICTFFVIISIFSTSFLHILSHFFAQKNTTPFPCSIFPLFYPYSVSTSPTSSPIPHTPLPSFSSSSC